MDDQVTQGDVSMDEIEAEDAVSLPNKEVLSLLDVNANVDLGVDPGRPGGPCSGRKPERRRTDRGRRLGQRPQLRR